MPRDPATPRRGTGQGPQTEGWAQRVAVALLGGPARQGTGTRADTVGSLPVIVFSPRKEGTADPSTARTSPQILFYAEGARHTSLPAVRAL